MARVHILVVEDDLAQRMVIQSALEKDYSMEMVTSIQVAKERILTESFDFFLLDIHLDDGDGFSLCQFIRGLKQHHHTPVVFLTSRPDVPSKVQGFNLGADDYLVKPVDPEELRARIKAHFRKFQTARTQGRLPLVAGDLILDLETQRISCESGDSLEGIDLTPLEFKLLLYLAKNPGSTMTREEILREVWGKTTHVMDRSVDTYIAALRKKLGPRGAYIKSVHGVGYQFVPSAPLKMAA